MGMVFHLLKKDMRRFWLPLCVLAGYLSAHAAVLLRNRLPGVPAAVLLNPVTLELLIFVFMVLLVWEDPPAGSTVFWLTRPIRRRSLLAAKGAFIVLFFIAMPVAADLFVLIKFGLEPGRVIPSLIEILAPHLAVLGIGASVAVLATNLRSIALAIGIGLLFTIVSNNLVAASVPTHGWIALAVCETLVFAVTVAVVLHQYSTRRTRRSILILVSGLLAIFCLFRFTDYEGVAWLLEKANGDSAAGRQIEVSFAARVGRTLSYGSSQNRRSNSENLPSIVGALDVRNIPPSQVVVLTGLQGRLEYPDGSWIVFVNRYPRLYGNPLRAFLPGFKGSQADGVTRLLDILSPSGEEYRLWSGRTGTFVGEARCELYRDTVIGEVPLVPGTRFQAGSTLLQIINVELVADRRLDVAFEGRRIVSSSDGVEGLNFHFVDRRRRQVLGGLGINQSKTLPIPLIMWGHHLSHFVTSWGLHAGTAGFPVDQEWLSDATMLVVDRVRLGRFSRSFRVPDFRMEDYTEERWVERMRAGK